MAVAIDAAVLDATFVQMSPPAIVRPYIDLSSYDEEMERKIDTLNKAADERLAEWIASSDTNLKQLEETLASADEVEQRHLDNLLRAAILIEDRAKEFAAEMARQVKSFRKTVKRAKAASPRVGRFAERTLKDGEKMFERELKARLDAALTFRALRARYTPHNDTGIVISDPADVDRLFAEALAS